uniref:Acetyl-coenzyme A transporter 1 n=1 Tax=Meloidogyne hapla TaxID=6305 RepID=A0A1I8BIG5_MELHA
MRPFRDTSGARRRNNGASQERQSLLQEENDKMDNTSNKNFINNSGTDYSSKKETERLSLIDGPASLDLQNPSKASQLSFQSQKRSKKDYHHVPHTPEDLMAHEPNFGGNAQLGFYYPESAEDDSYDENEALKPAEAIMFARKEGIPLGLIAAIPLLLQSKGITYAQQAVFSFAYWPFSMKLLWAPIVDSIYFKRIGRRKSWMVPCQYLIGIFLLVVSYHVPEIMGTEEDRVNKKPPNVFFLMCVFLPLNFLAATQDIAVDGWALTMLSRKNVGYASTCNVVGQTIGVFLGNVVFLALQSKEFANRFRAVPEEKGFVQLDGLFFLIYFFFWIF